MWRRIWAVAQKEFILIRRDKSTLLMQLLLPLIMLVLFGYAMDTNVCDIALVVADQSLDPASHDYVNALTTSGYFEVVEYVRSEAEVTRALDEGRARAGVVIPSGFSALVERGDAQVLFLVDGSDFFTSLSAYSAGEAISQAHSTEVLLKRVERSGLSMDVASLLPVSTSIRILYNPNMDSFWFMIPSLAAMLMQTQSIILTTVSVVRERETGTIEQVLVTPIRPLELMLGKIAPNILLAVLNMLTIVAAGVFWFGVPFQGSFWLLLSLSVLFIFAGTAMGLLISTVSKNQAQSLQIVMMVMLVGIMLGGFLFPRESSPLLTRYAGNIFPMTYFIPIARGIISKGIGIDLLWANVLPMGIQIIALVALATRVFRQDLE